MGPPGDRGGLSLRLRLVQGHVQSGLGAGRCDSTSVNLHNGWHVETFGAVDGPESSATPSDLPPSGGFVLSLVLGALIYVLGTSRSRALGLVDERTKNSTIWPSTTR